MTVRLFNPMERLNYTALGDAESDFRSDPSLDILRATPLIQGGWFQSEKGLTQHFKAATGAHELNTCISVSLPELLYITMFLTHFVSAVGAVDLSAIRAVCPAFIVNLIQPAGFTFLSHIDSSFLLLRLERLSVSKMFRFQYYLTANSNTFTIIVQPTSW